MKKQLLKRAMIAVAGVGLMTGSSVATPVYFDIDKNNSSVGFTSYQQGVSVKIFSKTYTIGNGSSLSVGLAAGLDEVQFTLNDNTTSDWFNFLTFTASGTGIGSFDIAASLAFESPIVGSANGVGEGGWGSVNLFNVIKLSGGFLDWEDNTIGLTDSWGNAIVVEFEEGIAIQANTSVNLKARITNYGGGTAPVPEPATMLLFGTGLLGLATVGRKKFRK